MEKRSTIKRKLLLRGAAAGSLAFAGTFVLLLAAAIPFWNGALPVAGMPLAVAAAVLLASFFSQVICGDGEGKGALVRAAAALLVYGTLLLVFGAALPKTEATATGTAYVLSACAAGNITGSIVRKKKRQLPGKRR